MAVNKTLTRVQSIIWHQNEIERLKKENKELRQSYDAFIIATGKFCKAIDNQINKNKL